MASFGREVPLRRMKRKFLIGFGIGLAGLATAPLFFMNSPQVGITQAGGVSFAIGGQWRGIAAHNAAVFINDNEAQDAQNVDIGEFGYSIKKRDGYALHKAIGISTHPINSNYFARMADGNDGLFATNEKDIYVSESGGTYTAIVTTDTADSYYDFDDNNGIIFRANSNRDEILSYNGTAVTYYPSHPKGDQFESLSARAAISGTTANPNRIHFSADSDFANFTTGTDEADPFTEDVGLPGDRVNAIKWAFGNLYFWTKNTFAFWFGTNQYDGVIQDISKTVGSNQPFSIVFDMGVIYFQAADNHFYAYDGGFLTKISENIENIVSNLASTGESKSWTQTSESEFSSGTNDKTSTTLTSGSVVLSTWTATDNDDSSFAATSSTNVSIGSDVVQLSVDNSNPLNNGFETGTTTDADNWTEGACCNWTRDNSYAQAGSWSMKADAVQSYYLRIYDYNDSLVETSSIFTYSSLDTWEQRSYSMSSFKGQNIRIAFFDPSLSASVKTTDLFYCSGNTLSWYHRAVGSGEDIDGIYLDTIAGGRSSITSGDYTSNTFDTAFSSPAWLSSNASWTTNGNTISIQTQVSDDDITYDSLAAWTTGSAPTSGQKRYLRYRILMSTALASTQLPSVSAVTFAARSGTGTYITQSHNIGSNITAYKNFIAVDDSDGGTITYSIRTATTEGGLSSASWTTVTNNTEISATERAWEQVRMQFVVTSATQNPTVNSIMTQWDEGNIVRSFGISDEDHRILWSVADGSATAADITLIYDPRFNTWLKYDFPFIGPTTVNNKIYFGDASAGNVYLWPSGSTDNGTAITSYWKSKDFTSGSPFSEKIYRSLSLMAKTETGSNMDITYIVDGITSTSYNVSLTESSNRTYINNNRLLPSGTFGTVWNIQFGNDDADAPFEMLSLGYDYETKPWRVRP